MYWTPYYVIICLVRGLVATYWTPYTVNYVIDTIEMGKGAMYTPYAVRSLVLGYVPNSHYHNLYKQAILYN